MNIRTTILAAALLVLGTVGALAHEGHAHTIMGTITAVRDAQLDVKTTDGKAHSITMNEKTAITRGTAKLSAKDLAAGQRVVVDVGDGKAPLVARAVKVGAENTGRIAAGQVDKKK